MESMARSEQHFFLFAIVTLKYKKYRNTLKGKENKKSKQKLLASTCVILHFQFLE